MESPAGFVTNPNSRTHPHLVEIWVKLTQVRFLVFSESLFLSSLDPFVRILNFPKSIGGQWGCSLGQQIFKKKKLRKNNEEQKKRKKGGEIERKMAKNVKKKNKEEKGQKLREKNEKGKGK